MSASAIVNAIYTTLSAASVLGNDAVSINSYAIMETASNAAAVVSWDVISSSAVTFGNPRERTRKWFMRVDLFIKDLGDPVQALNRMIQTTDKVITALEGDDTLQGTAEALNSIDGMYTPGRIASFGGAAWLPIEFRLEVLEWANSE